MASSTVLIVEDSPALGEILARLITHHQPQARAVVVASVRDAQQILQDQPVLAVLSDYTLPDGSAVDVLTAAHTRDITMPVVVISGRPDVAPNILAAGAAGFVLKPFVIEELLAVLGQVLP